MNQMAKSMLVHALLGLCIGSLILTVIYMTSFSLAPNASGFGIIVWSAMIFASARLISFSSPTLSYIYCFGTVLAIMLAAASLTETIVASTGAKYFLADPENNNTVYRISLGTFLFVYILLILIITFLFRSLFDLRHRQIGKPPSKES